MKLEDLLHKTRQTLEFPKILELIATYASSSDAKERILALEPQTELSQAAFLQRQSSDAKGLLLRRGAPSFAGARNILTQLHRAQLGSTLSPRDLLDGAQILKIARGLISYRKDDGQETGLDGYFENLTENKYLEEKILFTILSEEEIADEASPELKTIRRKTRDVNGKIRDILNKLIHSPAQQKYLQDPIITMRAGRYVVPVKSECRGDVPGLVHDTSASGSTLFVEPMGVVEANNELRLLATREKQEIDRILSELSNELGGVADAVAEDYRIIVELDAIFARARFGRDYNCCEPKLTENGTIVLKKARHPLIARDKVVPINLELSPELHTLMITGPNTGGKTVTLKTIGLFSLMAAAGLPICADEGSEMTLFTRVFADIGDEQSIEQSLSTFSSHMKNIVDITGFVDDRTLVLFDELGAGTDPTEGAALAVSILEYVKDRGAKCAATTHYSELKLYALSADGVENASCEFDVETLRPTYRLIMGIPGKSNAFAISQKLGLPGEIIEAAQRRLSDDNKSFEEVIGNLDKNRLELEKELEEARTLKAQAQEQWEAQKQKKEHYEKTRDQALNSARLEAKRIVEAARFAYEQVMDELNRMKKEQSRAERDRAIEQGRSAVRGILKEADKKLEAPNALRKTGTFVETRPIHKGDSVQILNLNRPATVVTPPDKDGNMTVQAGIMKITVNRRDVKLTREKDEPRYSGGSVVKTAQDKRIREAKLELDLRGQDTEEGILNMEKFLDDAVLTGLSQVTIIHGKGTGALRAAVQQKLRGHKHVKSFRLGKYGEGEDGVTVVELK